MTPPHAADLWHAWIERREPRAFEGVVTPLLPVLRDAARRSGLDAAEADDAVQDVLLDLARRRDERPAEVGFAPWLVRAVRLRAATMRRGTRRRRAREAASLLRHPPQRGTPDPDAADEAERALSSLDEDDREALRLRYVYDLDYRDLAFVLGVEESTCRVRVHRAAERLRARYGKGAMALLATWRPPEASGGAGLVGTAVAGGLAMGAAAKVGILASAAALAVAAWFGGKALLEDGAGDRPAPPAAPTLAREAEPPRLEGPRAAPPPAAAEPAPAAAPAPPAPEPAPPPADATQALVARIRREVEPAAWEVAGRTLEGRNGIVIVRAPQELHEAVEAWLRVLRGPDDPEVVQPIPGLTMAPGLPADAEASRAALAECRAMLQRMAVQEGRLLDALRLFRAGRAAEGARLAAEARADEPDHPLAIALTTDPPPPLPTPDLRLADGDHLSIGGATLAEWTRGWAGPTRAREFAAALARTGRIGLTLRGTEREDVLARGSVSLSLADATVPRILREIQVASLVDVVLDPRLRKDLADHRLVRFESVGRPLLWVLERLQEVLPPGHRFAVRDGKIVLTKDGLPEDLRLRYYDVKDLLDPSAPHPPDPPVPGAPPPAPPVYVAPR